MSCGNPHATPCTEVLSLIYVYIDDEIDEVHRIEVTTHLGECPPCVESYTVERRFKARLRDACLAEHVPDQVRSRIMAQIQQVSITYRYD